MSRVGGGRQGMDWRYWEWMPRRLPGWTFGYDVNQIDLLPSCAVQHRGERLWMAWFGFYAAWSWGWERKQRKSNEDGN